MFLIFSAVRSGFIRDSANVMNFESRGTNRPPELFTRENGRNSILYIIVYEKRTHMNSFSL